MALLWGLVLGVFGLLSAPAMAVTTVASVSAGANHTCALTSAGGVLCWGWNYYGQLGDGTTTTRLTPVAVSGLSSRVVAIHAGVNHTCAAMSAGGVECWGYNAAGQLGNGTLSASSKPVAVSGLSTSVIAVSAGSNHTCAVTSGGGVKCWGDNAYGQLGNGTSTAQPNPRPVDVSGLGSGVVAISAGDNDTCALTSAGAVWCWGWNDSGQLGDGTTTTSFKPVAVSGLSSGVVAISAGDYHTCALTSGGAVKCWGANAYGQLGNGTDTYAPNPRPVDVSGLSSGVIAISAGADHECALTSTGGVKCWGWNDNGQLGNGTIAFSSTPIAVSGLSSGVIAIGAGAYSECAVTSAGGVKCWGLNDNGQLGNGTTTTSPTPVDVIGLGPGVPNAVTISSRPSSVTFGRATTIAGKLSGKGNAGVKVTLEASPYPYTGGFKPTALTATTNATGGYSLTVTPTVDTHYRVTANTEPPVTSSQTAVSVRVRVSLRLSTRTPAIGRLVRFSGTVTPAHNGMVAQIQKRTSTGTWRTVASATLVAAAPVNGIAVSKFSKRLRISRNATYRVQVNPRDGNHTTGTSPTRTVRVH